MKRVVVFLAVFGLAVGMTSPAFAIKEFNDVWTKVYVEKSENEAFKTAAKEAKCGVCHVGQDKKKRNAYGTELAKVLKAKELKPRFASEKDKVVAEIEEQMKKVGEMKGPDGKTYAERIKAGQLPADNPK